MIILVIEIVMDDVLEQLSNMLARETYLLELLGLFSIAFCSGKSILKFNSYSE